MSDSPNKMETVTVHVVTSFYFDVDVDTIPVAITVGRDSVDDPNSEYESFVDRVMEECRADVLDTIERNLTVRLTPVLECNCPEHVRVSLASIKEACSIADTSITVANPNED